MTSAPETAFGPQPVLDAAAAQAMIWVAEGAHPDDPVAEIAARALAIGEACPQGALRPLALDQIGASLRLTMAAPARAPLTALLAEGPPTLADALDIAVALTEAVLALHERRIVHGHLSPGSVFADPGGVEIALHPDCFRARLDTLDQIAGRSMAELACLAPEQTGRTAHRTDRRCDLYALGAILQHLLTGRPAFAPQDRPELIHQHLAVTPPTVTGVPCALAAVVARLLQKAPEKRYQTAFGLLADLRHLRDALRDGGTVDDFPIALQDDRAAFRLPRRLYGREAHLARLAEAHAASAAPAELVLIGGYSGAGKSALVRAFIDSVPGAMALSGKYDQIQTLPYKAIQEALRGFVHRLIAQGEAARLAWCARFVARLGDSAEVLVDFLPELALVVGPQPAPEKMEAAERDQRFKIATQHLFEMLATPERPAILFLDDLQWADAASLTLLENILTTGDMPGLTILGAYRDNEVGAAHGLRRMTRALAAAGVRVHDLSVGPLCPADTAQLTADTLGLTVQEIAELAEAVQGKTQGNPFHVRQLLATLHEEDAISFSSSAEAWRWNIAQVRARVVGADIAALMAARIDRLGPDVAETLRLAACFGAQFTEAALSIVDDRDDMARRRGLTEAEAEGLIVHASAGDGSLAFSHDRVQEAAYARLTEQERASIHHRIGIWLLKDIRDPEEDDRLFAALDQIRQGLSMVRDPALGRRVTAVTLIAARRAKAVAAYDLAQRCLGTVASLPAAISGVSWAESPDIAYRLEIERLEADFLIQGFEVARPRFDALMVKLTDDRRKAEVHQLLVTLFTFRSDYRSAIAYGVDGLNLLGVRLSGPYGPKIGAGLAFTEAQLLRHDVYDFSRHPRMQNPAVEQIMEMLLILSTPAFLENKDLFVLISLKMFSLTLRHGMTHAGVASICYYALVNYIAFGAVNRASRIIENLFPLFDVFEVSSHVRGRVNYTYSMVVGWYHDSYGDLLTRLETGIEHSWKAADLEYVGYYFFGILKYHFVMGRPLGEISARLTEIDRYQRRLRHDVLSGLHDSYASFIAHATGAPDAPLWGPEDVALEGRMHGEASKGGFYQAYFLLAQVFGDMGLAADIYRKLLPLESFTILGPDYADYHLCGVLLHTRAGDALPGDLAAKRARRLKKHAARLARLARKYPANHRPHHALAQAELARIDRGPASALPLYEEAARLASHHGLVHYAALACELGAACAGEARVAERDRLIQRAHGLYDGWGATRKAKALAAAHPALFADAGGARGMQGGDALDLDTLIKASKAIFESLDFDTLLIRLMAIAVENAGADFGALYLVEADGPHLAVEARVEGGKLVVATAPGTPALHTLHPARNPREIVASVAATGRAINLDAGDGAFAATRYIQTRQPRAAACLPVARSGQTEAIIYLENSLTAGVFTPARREMLQTVASLAAISLSNARLFAQQEKALALEKRATEELSRLNDLKDNFLANTSHELRTPLNGIIGLADSMIGGIDGDLPDRAVDTLKLIVNSGRRLSSLVNDILDFSRLKENELVLTKRPVDLRSAVDVVAALIGPKARQNKVTIFNEVDQSLPAVLADEDRLQQILLNLVDNGVKFAAPGEVRISARIDDDRVHVTVADDGPGIGPEDRERIFQSFEQADASIQRGQGGAGLGLTITRKLAELHGGAVALNSAPGVGARFSFDLALAGAPAQPAEARASLSRIFAEPEPERMDAALTKAVLKTPARKAGGARQSALVVDDDPVNRQVLKNYLELADYEAMLASDGPEALEMLDQGYEPDIVLLDVMMPKMSGYEVCRAIRRRNSANRLPVIMLTAKNRVDDLEIAFDAGANDYLAKPFSRDELFARMRTNIDLSKINIAYERFVPVEFLRFLARRSIIDIELGDNTEKKMSVMFSDIRAFTSLAENMTPSESFSFISDYFRRLGPLVRDNEGFLNQYLGDGMMALFPRTPDDAVNAAIAMQQELDRFNAERAGRGESTIQTGIGLHSGDLVLGIIGDKHRRSGNVVSDAVNLASRIEGLTGHYGIRIAASREMIQQLRAPAEVPHRELDIVWVKGKDRPVAVCEIFAGDPPDSIALKTQTRVTFEGAVAAYRQGAFAEARDAFAEVLRAHPADNVAQIFHDRCARYLATGAPAEWAGIETIA
jgi:predicted ATPase/signal transduction histidine kinase/CheY-like chemotaxis protein/class 3 adenylate cyclase